MPLHSLLKEIAEFEQCEVEAVFATFDAAAARLNLSQRDNALRKLLAGTVIQCVRSGERDPERLWKMVLGAVQKGITPAQTLPA
jgi:capsule polysaccharide export protein KpsE/RkpR